MDEASERVVTSALPLAWASHCCSSSLQCDRRDWYVRVVWSYKWIQSLASWYFMACCEVLWGGHLLHPMVLERGYTVNGLEKGLSLASDDPGKGLSFDGLIDLLDDFGVCLLLFCGVVGVSVLENWMRHVLAGWCLWWQSCLSVLMQGSAWDFVHNAHNLHASYGPITHMVVSNYLSLSDICPCQCLHLLYRFYPTKIYSNIA